MSSVALENNKAIERSEWFDNFISKLRVDQLKLETNLADQHTEDAYNALISNDFKKAAAFASKTIHQEITRHIVGDFLGELFLHRKANIEEIAFDISGQEVLVWAVVNDDDENAEKDLYLSESLANAKYESLHYNISVTVLESSDNIQIPSQYSVLEKKRTNA